MSEAVDTSGDHEHDVGGRSTDSRGASGPLVSIVTPTFNRAKFLPLTIESVLAQSYPNWELWIVDDGSTDDTAAVMSRFTQDSRIHYIVQPENVGQAVARNVGLSQSRGEYVCFLDSDNIWLPHKLASQIEFLRSHSGVGVVYAEGLSIDEQGKVLERNHVRRHSGMITAQLLKENCVGFNTAMVRAELLRRVGGMDESVRFGDDYDLWLRISPHCSFQYIDDIVCKYRVMRNQISSNKDARFAANRLCIERFLAGNPQFSTRPIKANTWSSFYGRRGRYRASVGRLGPAILDLATALRYRPTSAYAWRGLARAVAKSIGLKA